MIKLALGSGSLFFPENTGPKSEWQEFLNQKMNAGGVSYVCFPNLDTLFLDFEDWDLGEEDWLSVCASLFFGVSLKLDTSSY